MHSKYIGRTFRSAVILDFGKLTVTLHSILARLFALYFLFFSFESCARDKKFAQFSIEFLKVMF